MLSNSVAAAALATAYVIALVLHLNPALPLHPVRAAPLVATVGVYYIVHLTVIFYVLLIIRQLLAHEVFSPAWINVDVTDEERSRLGPVLERHNNLIDDAIGRAMAAMGPDDLLLVVSGFGMEPLGLGKRMIERLIGDRDLSGTHETAPDGFLLAYGASVLRGRPQARASVVDVTPTILYFLGLPLGRDMDGYAKTDLFQRSFTDERPITFIPTYDR